MNRSRFALLVLLATTCSTSGASPSPEEFFEREVRPLLVDKCQSCHAGKKLRGGLDLTSRAAMLKGGDSGPAMVSGDPEKSLLIQAVRYHDALRMPPKEKLADRDVKTLERWVKMGAPWPDDRAKAPIRATSFKITEEQRRFWSFQPIRSPALPRVKDRDWPRNPIDHFILAKLESQNLRPARAADRRALIRRVTFDLLGLPPTLEEVEAFVRDRRPDSYERLVDRLLASPARGERWGRHWLDVVRYTDSFDARGLGSEGDCSEAWRYRDWVVRAINADRPYDQFVRDQIAGDVEPGDVEGILATGMLAIGNWGGGDADKEKLLTDVADDQIDVVSKAFLGLTVSCARCHDHKFDPISTADYYALAGIFFSTHILPNVGPKTGGPPMLRIPLATPDELKLRKQREARIQQLANDRRTLQQAAQTVQAKQHLARATEYLTALAEWRANPSRSELSTIAKERHLSEVVLRQLDAYLSAETYAELKEQSRDVLNRAGIHALRGKADCPNVTFNTTDKAEKLLTFTLPARSINVHPGPRSGVVIAWRSPVRGAVRLEGSLRDADPACGDGIAWTIQIRRGDALRTIATGAILNGGSHSLHSGANAGALSAIDVQPEDTIELIVSPKGGYECDTTTVQLTIRSEETTWDLTRDALAKVGRASEGLWKFLDTGVPRRVAAADVRTEWLRAVSEVGKDRARLDRIRAKLPADANGPFAVMLDVTSLPTEMRRSFDKIDRESSELRQAVSRPLEFTNGAQEGGVPNSPHAGIHDVRIHVRGRYDRLGDVVPRRFPEILAGTTAPPRLTGSGRRELAHWLTKPDHPLTARVMVNRLWQHHFGRGIVGTSSNFGALGERPTHPELLDWLADEFIRSGWSMKRLHRLIVTSATYQQSTQGDEATLRADPDNLLCGRTIRRRLEAEAIRDSLLSVAGSLDRRLEGKGTRDFASPRRTLYQMTVRSDRSGFAPLFDVADSTQSVAQRVTSTVAPQALFLLNNPFTREQSATLARRINDSSGSDREKIDRIHRMLYARPPLPEEVELGLSFLKARSWEDYAQVLLCANEFIYLD